jgi:predicted metal-binding membrane protein
MMSDDGVLIALLRRDRLIVGGALFVLAALAWAYLLWLNSTMMAPMPGMDNLDMGAMSASPAMTMAAWNPRHFGFLFAMWTVMMVAMMTPSVASMVLIYARVGRQTRAQGMPFAPATWFAGGYLCAWAVFSLVAAFAQYELERRMVLSPAMRLADKYIAGAVLVLAGLYQWTPLKDVCLANCRAPFSFIQQHGGFQPAAAGSLRLGLQHGMYCIGCCWFIMALLFVGGVMNIAWIVLLAAVVIGEKLLPEGRFLARGIGFAAMAAGIWMITR